MKRFRWSRLNMALVEMPDLSTSTNSDDTVLKGEWMLVLAIVLAGVILRCWQPSHLAVEHFDEGVYASNLFCPPDNAYPFRHLYAPPLLPGLLEWALIVSGGALRSVMWVNVVAGCVMVPSVWWVGRQWFGPVAGLTAATLAAVSELHILYSRSALTDVLLCLWMLWGVYWCWRAVLTDRPAAIALAAVFASLAWWTKYNGWLTLAVSGSGMVAWLFVGQLRTGVAISRDAKLTKRDHSQLVKSQLVKSRPSNTLLSSLPQIIITWGTVASITLFAAWLPILVGLQDHGGYEVVSTNHARYFVGLEGWWSSFVRQAGNVWLLDPGLAVYSLVAIGAGGYAVVTLLRCPRSTASRLLATWMLLAWFFGLLVAIPLYTPYSRLVLPWLVPVWFAGGLGLQVLMETRPDQRAFDLSTVSWRHGVVCGTLVLLIASVLWRSGPAYDDRSSLAKVADDVRSTLSDAEDMVVSVIGEPGLFFQLAAGDSSESRRVYVPTANLASISPLPEGVSVTMYVVLGPHAPDASPDAGMSWAEANMSLVDEWPYRRSTLVLLDEFSPSAVSSGDIPTATIRLYRIDSD